MIGAIQGFYQFTTPVLSGWQSTEIGVYYLGELLPNGNLAVHYIGQGCGEGGICKRLKDHLGEWKDVTHFGYEVCDNVLEAGLRERALITQYKPKYNTQHV